MSLFRLILTLVNSVKRRREFELIDLAWKEHVLRADSDPQLHWWIDIFDAARNKIPSARPHITKPLPPSLPQQTTTKTQPSVGTINNNNKNTNSNTKNNNNN